jgi:biotin carboxylase
MLMVECILSKTLLIIGAGAEQIPAYRAAKARGLVVVATDADRNAPAFSLSDYQILASTRDPEETLARVLEFSQSTNIDGVMTIANDVPYTVALVADTLGLKSISLDAARNSTNKVLMKKRFVEAGVNCPWFSDVNTLEELVAVKREFGTHRLVLKPVDGRGARGVLIIDDSVDLGWAFHESQRWGDSGKLIIEKFIDGIQLSTESFILDGKCYTPAMADRNYENLSNFKPYVIENGGTIPASLPCSEEEINDLILRGAQALGIEEGIVKGDIVIDETSKPLIIELAPRLSGGWFATHQIPAASGVDLVNAVISYSLNESIAPASLIRKWNRSTAIRYWFPPAGIIKNISGEEILKSLDGLLHYGFFRTVGDTQPIVTKHSDRFGFVIFSADNKKEVLEKIEKALSVLQIEVV